jgi:hypothetical protein
MPEEARQDARGLPGAPGGAEPVAVDMTPLIESVRALLDPRVEESKRWAIEDFDHDAFARETGFAPRRKGKPEVVLGQEIAVELGHPATASQAILLTTAQPGLVQPGRVSLLGPDLDCGTPGVQRPFAQVVMLALRPGSAPDPFELESAQFLINRLPGYMVRSIPGRLWVRVSKRGRAAGLGFDTVARALVAAYEDEFDEVEGVEVIFVTSSAADVEALAPVALEASVISGKHKKLVLSPDGELECSELSCETCDEKPVCDDLRDIVRERRRRSNR